MGVKPNNEKEKINKQCKLARDVKAARRKPTGVKQGLGLFVFDTYTLAEV